VNAVVVKDALKLIEPAAERRAECERAIVEDLVWIKRCIFLGPSDTRKAEGRSRRDGR
jgi:hypothetical protein